MRLKGFSPGYSPAAYIFDMDGTITDNMHLHTRVWLSYLRELGAEPPEPAAFHAHTAGNTNPEILRKYLGQSLSDADVARFAAEKEIRYRGLVANETAPLAGLPEFLTRARQAGIGLALATSAGMDNVDFLLPQLGLDHAFDVIVTSGDVTRGKPDPEVFLIAAERLGVAPERCLVFEDAPKGIEAAHRAGMPVAVILTTLDEQEALALPGVIAAAVDFTSFEPPL